MSVESVLSLDRWKSRLKSVWSYDPKDRVYVLVLLGLVATMLGFYYLSLEANDYETVMVPRLTIYATLIILAGALLNAFFDVGKRLKPSVERREAADDEEDLFDTDTELAFDLSHGILARKTALIVLYFLATFYVGFFTSTVAFTFAYVYLHTDEHGLRRWFRAAGVAVLATVMMWALFVYILGMIQIYRLGPLP